MRVGWGWVGRRRLTWNVIYATYLPTSIRKVIFLIFKELIYAKKMFSKHFDQPNIGKLQNIFRNTDPIYLNFEDID